MEQTMQILGLIGLGSILPTIISFFITSKKIKNESKNALKEPRYKAILILCYDLVFYEREKEKLLKHRPNIDSIEKLKEEIHLEFINMSLYASDNVILQMREFLIKQNGQTFNNLTLEMRKDLYGIRTNLKSNQLDIKI